MTWPIRTPARRGTTPRRDLPWRCTRGFVLTEAFNIQMYIDEAFSGRALQPEAPRGRAEVRMFVSSLEALVAVLQSGSGRASFNKRSFKRMEDVFVAVDHQLKASHAPWLDGAAPGQRDISFLPLVELGRWRPIPAESGSSLLTAGAAHPPFQKDQYRRRKSWAADAAVATRDDAPLGTAAATADRLEPSKIEHATAPEAHHGGPGA